MYFTLAFVVCYFFALLLKYVYSFLPFRPKKDLVFLEAYSPQGSGYNYRVSKWLDLFRTKGLSAESFLLVDRREELHQANDDIALRLFLVDTMVKRLFQVINSRNYKKVIVRRTLLLYNDYGNLFLEKFLCAIHPCVLLDIDDDLSSDHDLSKSSVYGKIMGFNPNSFYESFSCYHGFIAGSDYLKGLILKHTEGLSPDRVVVIPTCVDYASFAPKIHQKKDSGIVFGWIGGNQNLPYLKEIIPALNTLCREVDIRLHVIAGVSSYDFGAEFPVKFIPYSLETEVDHLRETDIGLMPMPDNPVTRGKCGFKLIQYMGLGIPGIASAVGVNRDIVDHDRNGWLVAPQGDWVAAFRLAVSLREQWPEMGASARKRIAQSYSFEAHFSPYLAFIRKMGNVDG